MITIAAMAAVMESQTVSRADTVDHVGYSCHRPNDDSQEFNGIKIRLTNLKPESRNHLLTL